MTPRCRIGTVISIGDAMLAELAGGPLDLAWIDLEHGALSVTDVPPLAIALRAAGCEAHVRLPSWRSEALGPVLDAGVDGIVAPGMERARDAAALVARMRHPPAGSRGYGPRRAGDYGRAPVPAEVACTVQIESPAGVRAAAEIAAVDGVTALVVGCADLSLALGCPGRLDAPELREAVLRVAAGAEAGGAAFGLAGGGDERGLAGLAPPSAALIVHSVDVRLYARAIDQATAAVGAAVRG